MRRALLAFACGVAFVTGCSGQDHAPPTEPEAVQQRADDSARAWLRDVQRVHALADRATSPPAQREAAGALAAVARTQAPSTLPPAASDRTRQDLYGRAADLLALLGDHPRALELIDEGLTLRASTQDPFFTQLVLQRAEVKAALGDSAGAEEARNWARQLVR